MSTPIVATLGAAAAWFTGADCRLDDLDDVLRASTDLAAYPYADRVEQGVLIYSVQTLADAEPNGATRRAVQEELIRAFVAGPGIVVMEGAFDTDAVERVTAVFFDLVAAQRAAGVGTGDHFAMSGTNDRLWNCLEKLAVADPEAFVDYYASDALAMAGQAWLGPGYQVTSQVNIVNPGGEGQTVHRDYHLGFMSERAAGGYPAHVHRLSPALTLQGAVAHCDMPVESGPTLYLPHSQKYPAGYLAYSRKEFQEYFLSHHVQLPLRTGDAVFFNPALFHAAGSNQSANIKRMANLLQISSAFGRAMEAVDRERVVNAIYPTLLARKDSGASARALANAVAASAEGYAFPTNLDVDQPIDGLAPPSQAELTLRALETGTAPAELAGTLAAQAARHLSH